MTHCWKLAEKPLFKVSPRGNHSRLRAAQSPSNRYTCTHFMVVNKHFSITRFMSFLHILTCSWRSHLRQHSASQNYGTPVLSVSHRLSHANYTMGRKLGTEVGVNSCSVALIATESVSIALSWLLLPSEVGVNRHGHTLIGYLRLV